MNFRPLIAFSILAPCLTSTTLSFAQLSLDDDSRNDIEPTSPFATAAKVENTPYLDGEVLDDDVWEAAKPVTGFWQTTPNERQPVSEKTELRIVYTNRTLYFGFVTIANRKAFLFRTAAATILLKLQRRHHFARSCDWPWSPDG